MDDIMLRFTEITESGEDAEVIDDKDMVRLIETNKEGLDEYFGGDTGGANTTGQPSDNEGGDDEEVSKSFYLIL
jgi:hypothetical protein